MSPGLLVSWSQHTLRCLCPFYLTTEWSGSSFRKGTIITFLLTNNLNRLSVQRTLF